MLRIKRSEKVENIGNELKKQSWKYVDFHVQIHPQFMIFEESNIVSIIEITFLTVICHGVVLLIK